MTSRSHENKSTWQRQAGDGLKRGVGEAELLQSLGVVEQLLEVCPDGVVGQVQGQQGAQAHEDVVREDGQAVVGERQRDELETVREHRRVQMLDLIVGEVEVAQRLGHVGEGAVGHHLELVMAQVQRLQLRVAEGITGKGSEPETGRIGTYNFCVGYEMNMFCVPWVEANFIGLLC